MQDYGQLEEIVYQTIQETVRIKNFGFFYQRMEEIFTRFGFREKTQGGGLENILIERIDAVGDFVLTSAAIREIRRNYPYAYITLIVSKTVYPMAEHCPYVNEVLVFDMPAKNILEEFINALKFSAAHLWKRRYSLAISPRYWVDNISWMLTYLSGAVERVGYNGRASATYVGENPNDKPDINTLLFTHAAINPKEIIHDAARNLYLLESFGLKIHRTDLEVWFDSGDLYEAKKILEGFALNRFKIAVGIGAGHPERHYPVEKYLVALKELVNKGAAIVIIGGPAESEDAKFLEDNLPKEFVKNFVALKVGWRVDAAAISLTDMYVGNFTGACDVASALKKCVVALSPEAAQIENLVNHGLSQCAQYYPYQTSAIVLRPKQQIDDCAKEIFYGGCKAGKSHCIAQIEPEEIVDAVDKMFFFMKYSGIKKISCPPIIKSIDQVTPLNFGYEFD